MNNKMNSSKIKISVSKEYGSLEIVKELIEDEGVNIHIWNDYLLRLSARNGYFEIVKYLVENGANIMAENSYALIWALKNNHYNIYNYLIQK